MQTATYYSTIEYAASIAPTLDKPGEFIIWGEDICNLLQHIYPSKSYDEITVDLYDATKVEQDWEDPEEDED